jgi:uncharacterized protein YjbI with pentapeptide repeats
MALTRSQIARKISDEIGLSLRGSKKVISALTGAISRALKDGEEVRIRNFGRFRVISESGRRKNGFSSGESVARAARKVIRFKCSKSLKTSLQDETDTCEDLYGFNIIIEQLQKNFEIPDQIQKVLNDHHRWVESEGRECRRADLRRFDLKGADLFGSNLKSANLSGASLPAADLSDCDLENANLENANIEGASLAWANLMHAILRGACLREADLRWADLRWADLSEADLSGANLSGADLTNTVMKGTELRGARIKNTILEKKNLFSTAAFKLKLRKKG